MKGRRERERRRKARWVGSRTKTKKRTNKRAKGKERKDGPTTNAHSIEKTVVISDRDKKHRGGRDRTPEMEMEAQERGEKNTDSG